MRHPRIATVGSVLHDYQLPSGSKHVAHRFEDRRCVADEMERVGHDDSVEARETEWTREVGNFGLHPLPHSFGESLERAGVAVDRCDVSAWTQQIGQGEGEISLAGAQLSPAAATVGDRVLQQPDEIGMIHAGALATDRTGRP